MNVTNDKIAASITVAVPPTLIRSYFSRGHSGVVTWALRACPGLSGQVPGFGGACFKT